MAQKKRIGDSEAAIADLDHRVDTIKTEAEASANRIVRLETSFQSMNDTLKSMDSKFDSLVRR